MFSNINYSYFSILIMSTNIWETIKYLSDICTHQFCGQLLLLVFPMWTPPHIYIYIYIYIDIWHIWWYQLPWLFQLHRIAQFYISTTGYLFCRCCEGPPSCRFTNRHVPHLCQNRWRTLPTILSIITHNIGHHAEPMAVALHLYLSH